jgi:Iap family predicted aminopeptidase
LERVSIDRAKEYIQGLCKYKNRLAGSEKEREAAEYIQGLLREFGYEDIKQSKFRIYGWIPKKCVVEIVSPIKRTLEAALLPYSNSVVLESNLTHINNVDYEKVTGKEGMIGLAPWGQHLYLSTMRTYYAAQRQKLSAVLIGSPDAGDLRKVVVVEVGGEMSLPLISISKEDMELLGKLMEKDDVKIRIETSVDTDAKATSKNLEVVVQGDGSLQHEVIVGAHYDAYFEGAADNAAPAAIVLELARLLRKYASENTIRRTVRFLFFGAEECGSTSYYYWVNGSRAFVSANRDIVSRTGIMLSMDSVGFDAPNYIATTIDLSEFAREIKVPMKTPPDVVFYGPSAYGSDHWFFETSGVSVIYGVSFPSPLYHTQRDSFENLNMRSVQFHCEYMKEALQYLCSTEVLPIDIFAPLERFTTILRDYLKIKDLPFDLSVLLRHIERVSGEKRSLERTIKAAIQSGDVKRIEEINRFLVSTANRYNQTIGWVWRRAAPSDVSYLSKLEFIADYAEISGAISALRKMPIANLDRETVTRYKTQQDNPFNWTDIHLPLEKLEDERSRVFRIVDDEISRLSEFFSETYQQLKAFSVSS